MNNKKPQGWGEDKLSGILQGAEDNVHATFANYKEDYEKLRSIDDALALFVQNNITTENWPIWNKIVRSHSCFRSAVRLAMAGQLMEASPVLRLGLECLVYGYYLFKNPDKLELWTQRGESNEKTREMRSHFKWSTMIKSLEEDLPEMYSIITTMYEWNIDQGAHPNPDGILGSSEIEHREDGTHSITAIYLHDGGMPMRSKLKDCARTGLAILIVSDKIWPDISKQLSIPTKIESLRRNL